jgi:hypothetical protein
MKMLRSFHVKVLVLSAIPELVSTWVSAFGFKPIEDERKQLNTMNLMLFRGTSLLIKNLEDCCGTNNQVVFLPSLNLQYFYFKKRKRRSMDVICVTLPIVMYSVLCIMCLGYQMVIGF